MGLIISTSPVVGDTSDNLRGVATIGFQFDFGRILARKILKAVGRMLLILGILMQSVLTYVPHDRILGLMCFHC